MNDPTMGEILRRLDDVVGQVASIAGRLHEDRLRAETTYVRLDVYNADRRGEDRANAEIQRDLDDLKRHNDTDAQWRRQMLLAFAVLAITSLVTIALAISNYLAR
jgi:hypothetical protein